jgi:hypothetical protein
MIQASIDTTRFDRDFELYKVETSKSVLEAVNYKLFDCARAAITGTPKADKGKIKRSLTIASKLYPKRTVAEMLVIMQHIRTGDEIQDLEAEAAALIKTRQAHTGFAKAGWIPAIKKLIKLVGREHVTIGGLVRAAFGGAVPASKNGSNVVGSVFNDVAGKGNTKAFVESIKEKGAQAGIDKVSSDMEKYLSKNLDIPIDHFNRS